MNTDYTTADLVALTIPKLKAIATELNLKFASKILKADLVALIEAEFARLAPAPVAPIVDTVEMHSTPVITETAPAPALSHVINTMPLHDHNCETPEFAPNRAERRAAKRQGQMRPDGIVKRGSVEPGANGFRDRLRFAPVRNVVRSAR